MIKFGLIGEGLTDHIVIEDILSGYLGDDHVRVYYLQPAMNNNEFGNWLNVFNYCKSNRFKEAFQSNDYIIIQIDTDVSEEQGYDISKTDENGNLFSPEELIIKVKEKFISLIGHEFYLKYSEKIIFAISVHSIECWLLPLYYQDQRKSAIVNCSSKLALEVNKKEKFYLDPKNKDSNIYAKISYKYTKKKTLLKYYLENPSFKIFIEELQARNIPVN
jgi:hypothetical protein